MVAAKTLPVAIAVGLMLALTGCGVLDISNLFNPDFLAAQTNSVSALPAEAPGLLVWVENRTDRWVQMVVSYRDAAAAVQNYTTALAPVEKSGQMLTCPVEELTMGDLSNLQQPGVQVFLTVPAAGGLNIENAPYIDVDPFGVLLREGVNYDCGDAVTFTVQPSSASSSGYQIIAYIRRAGA
ncbi:MAG: hypothetical protein AB1716_12905 [Planctomycetota bacterium]